MATLQGQNFRVCVPGSTTGTYKVIAMSTSCTITQVNNTEDMTTKDDVGLASKPVTTSKSWSVSVDSLDVTDAAAMLTAIKAMQPMTLFWSETSTTDNQTWGADNIYPRRGQAFLSDGTFTFDNRTNSAKQLQFQGTGKIDYETLPEETLDPVSAGSYTKGQFVRLFLSSDNTAAPAAVIGAALTLQLHVSVSLEDVTTKDTEGEWQVQEPTAISYDITTGALVRSGETIVSAVGAKAYSDLESIYNNGTPVKWKIANVRSDNNRTAASTIASGSATLTQLELTAANRQKAEYKATMQGFGTYTVGS